MKRILNIYIIALTLLTPALYASADNDIVEFQGQVSANAQYAPMDKHYTLIGARYLPQLNIYVPSNSDHIFDFELAADISAYYAFQNNTSTPTFTTHTDYLGEITALHTNNSHTGSVSIKPYRFWARYRYKQLDLRIGLQKIDFGSSSLLRPLQWFNSMDPRDPLKITNGVFGVLGRYYFENNANVWLWCLSMNTEQRGMDILRSDDYLPEFGTRLQYPVRQGEIALSYNHRWTALHTLENQAIQEDKIAIDGKWDVGVGLWFETSYTFLHHDVGTLTNQFAFNIGLDYTFGIGSGLGATLEHLITTYDNRPFHFENISNITALQLNYPLAMFDNLSLIAFCAWEQKTLAAYLSYMHSFEKVTLFANAYYNYSANENKLNALNYANTQTYTDNSLMLGNGVGIQMMLTFNH